MVRRSRFWQYKYLVEKDGEKCTREDASCKGKLVVHHINGNETDDRPENICLLCRSHNAREEPLEVSVREKKYEEGSSEMWVNINAERKYRLWVLNYIVDSKGGYIMKDSAIKAGAEKCELSSATTRKYLEKLTSELGVLKEVKDKFRGGKIIRFKEVSELRT